MLPDKDKQQHHDTPKRFNVGYYARETAELFHSGWIVASRHMREYRRSEKAKETRRYIVELLEEGLYDSVSRGTTEEKLNALRYFQRKKEFEQTRDHRPYTWGEQISSMALNGAFLGAIALMFSLSASWSCGSNQSQFCKDIRTTTGGIVQYFTQPRL
jgi:hypothetical protein